MRIRLDAPAAFSFRRTVLSHGWCSLPPFSLDRGRWLLRRVIDTGEGAVRITMRESPSGGVIVETTGRHGEAVRRAVRSQTTRILGLQEDLSGFYALAGEEKGFEWIPAAGAGRLLRAPTVYEDLVKLICTTNCSWSLTQTMIRRLVVALGRPVSEGEVGTAPATHDEIGGRSRAGAPATHGETRRSRRLVASGASHDGSIAATRTHGSRRPGEAKGFMLLDGAAGTDDLESEAVRRSFPTPRAMAGVPGSFYRNEVRAGYRAASLHELACRVASGELDVEAWTRSELPTADLKKAILQVKGAGPYAAENLLRLLGRHDGLALDSWCRKKFALLHGRGRGTPDRRIARHYARFGDYRGLALWCDLTRDWIVEEPVDGDAARRVM